MPSVVLAVDVEVDLPVEDTWAAAVDWAWQGTWIPATQVSVTSGRGSAVGDRIVARTALGPLGFDDPMEIVVWDAPRRCDVRHLGRVVRGSGSFRVDPLPAGRARFTWSEDVDLPLGRVGAAGWRLVAPLARAVLRLALRRFAERAARRPRLLPPVPAPPSLGATKE